MPGKYPIDFKKIKTYSVFKRKSKVRISDFAKPAQKSSSFKEFYNSLPDVLAVTNLRRIVEAIKKARKKKKPVIFMMGAHVLKCGLSPLIIDLIRRKIVTAVALNGAGIIHDTEIAMLGRTSEDVDASIQDGTFGMAKETAGFINDAINWGFENGLGIGHCVGEKVLKSKFPYKNLSVTAAGRKYKIPVTVHVAMGTDIIHQHPSCNGEAVGEGSLVDFRNFISEVSRLGRGGVVINFGSAVVLPEVFLKAITVARNLRFKVKNFTTANFDMFLHYRPKQNVLTRPVSLGGDSYNIIGHHEFMVPLLYRAIIESSGR
jgi:hypothetical protein